jgi:hypothetical protein
MDTKEWGKGFWLLIWIILYDEKLFPDLIEVKKFLDVIARNLPCDVCRSHIADKISKHNIMSTASRDELKEFFFYVYKSTSTSYNKKNIHTRYD